MPYICLMPLGISISWQWWKRISYLSWYFEVIIPSCYNTNWYGFSGNPTNSDNLIFASTWSQKQEYCYKSTVLRFTAAAKSLQSCLTLCYPTDGSPPGSSVPGILQARTLEWWPFPSPMHESEKWKGSRSVVSDSQWPHGLQPTRLLRPWDFPGKSTGVGCHLLTNRTAMESH